MTLGTIFKTVLGSSGSQYYDQTSSHKFLADRGGNHHYHHHYESYKKSKGKSKGDKKHAILSALTLLAFLFFLNILQSCLREQNQYVPTIYGTIPATGQQGKTPNTPTQGSMTTESEFRNKRVVKPVVDNLEYKYAGSRKSRTLMGYNEQATVEMPGQTATTPGIFRQTKFIRHYDGINNWTKELSQVSDKDLEDQKLKTLNFPLYWKNNRFASGENPQATPPSTILNRIESPVYVRNKTLPLVMRRIKKRERTTATAEPTRNLTRPLGTPLQPAKSVWEYKNQQPLRSEKIRPSQPIPMKDDNHIKHYVYYNRTGVLGNHTWQGYNQTQQGNPVRRESTTSSFTPDPKNPTTTQNIPNALSYVATTPRSRRSEYVSTIRPAEYEDYDRYSEPTREDAQLPPTPALGLDLNTYQTFPVYNYYNHRYTTNTYRENQTVDVVTAEPSSKTDIMEIDRIHNEVKPPTDTPYFHPVKTPPTYHKHAYYDKMKYRNRYPVHHGYYYPKGPIEMRYRYSPYRKTGTHEPGHFHDHHHDEFYTPVIIAKYPQSEEGNFDLIKFVWTMVSSFARPLTKLVPSFAKENSEEAQCYDLLVCEAQRVSRFMGPTAEALATTVGTLLTWAATEDTRQIVVDAINSGRENTCQQQIRDCEDRSGGKSAMTVIAQVMEMKLR